MSVSADAEAGIDIVVNVPGEMQEAVVMFVAPDVVLYDIHIEVVLIYWETIPIEYCGALHSRCVSSNLKGHGIP